MKKRDVVVNEIYDGPSPLVTAHMTGSSSVVEKFRDELPVRFHARQLYTLTPHYSASDEADKTVLSDEVVLMRARCLSMVMSGHLPKRVATEFLRTLCREMQLFDEWFRTKSSEKLEELKKCWDRYSLWNKEWGEDWSEDRREESKKEWQKPRTKEVRFLERAEDRDACKFFTPYTVAVRDEYLKDRGPQTILRLVRKFICCFHEKPDFLKRVEDACDFIEELISDLSSEVKIGIGSYIAQHILPIVPHYFTGSKEQRLYTYTPRNFQKRYGPKELKERCREKAQAIANREVKNEVMSEEEAKEEVETVVNRVAEFASKALQRGPRSDRWTAWGRYDNRLWSRLACSLNGDGVTTDRYVFGEYRIEYECCQNIRAGSKRIDRLIVIDFVHGQEQRSRIEKLARRVSERLKLSNEPIVLSFRFLFAQLEDKQPITAAEMAATFALAIRLTPGAFVLYLNPDSSPKSEVQGLFLKLLHHLTERFCSFVNGAVLERYEKANEWYYCENLLLSSLKTARETVIKLKPPLPDRKKNLLVIREFYSRHAVPNSLYYDENMKLHGHSSYDVLLVEIDGRKVSVRHVAVCTCLEDRQMHCYLLPFNNDSIKIDGIIYETDRFHPKEADEAVAQLREVVRTIEERLKENKIVLPPDTAEDSVVLYRGKEELPFFRAGNMSKEDARTGFVVSSRHSPFLQELLRMKGVPDGWAFALSAGKPFARNGFDTRWATVFYTKENMKPEDRSLLIEVMIAVAEHECESVFWKTVAVGGLDPFNKANLRHSEWFVRCGERYMTVASVLAIEAETRMICALNLHERRKTDA